jgi:hypothetical protein
VELFGAGSRLSFRRIEHFQKVVFRRIFEHSARAGLLARAKKTILLTYSVVRQGGQAAASLKTKMNLSVHGVSLCRT